MSDPEIVRALAASRCEFLRFLERRLGDPALAEDVLQEAFARSLDKLATLRRGESAVAWFYRVLRNAVIDHRRRHGTAGRALSGLAAELAGEVTPSAEVREVLCRCVGELATQLKPEYAEALQRVEVEGAAVKDYAAQAGISGSNAGVRLYRAREALRKQVVRCCGKCADDGCRDCSCGH